MVLGRPLWRALKPVQVMLIKFLTGCITASNNLEHLAHESNGYPNEAPPHVSVIMTGSILILGSSSSGVVHIAELGMCTMRRRDQDFDGIRPKTF